MDRINHFPQDNMFGFEHRLIHRRGGGGFRRGGGEFQNPGQPYQPGQNPEQNNRRNAVPQKQPRRYQKGKELQSYAKVNKERFINRMGKIEKKVKDLEKGEGVSQDTRNRMEDLKKYFEGDFKKWIETYERLQRDNADALEHGLATAEQLINELEANVFVGEDAGRFADLPEGKSYMTRVEESRVNEVLTAGAIESDIRSNGVQYMYVPQVWGITANGGKIVSETKLSSGFKMIEFTGKPGMTFDVRLPSQQFSGPTAEKPISVATVAGKKKGTVKLDLSSVNAYIEQSQKKAEYVVEDQKTTDEISDKVERFEKPKVERIRKERADGKERPKLQQDPELALDIVNDIQGKIFDADQALANGVITQAERDAKVDQLNDQLRVYRREFDQKFVQQIVRDLREGKMQLGSDAYNEAIAKVERRFDHTYGTAGDPDAEFTANHRHQLLRPIENGASGREVDEMPYIMSYLGGGKITFEKNPHYETREKTDVNEKNKVLAANKLAEVFMVKIKEGMTDKPDVIASSIMPELRGKNEAGEKYGMYLAVGGDLYERDKSWVGTDDMIVKGFENMLKNDPIAALKAIGANTSDLEAELAKQTIDTARTKLNEYEKNRDRSPEEIEKALSEVGNLTQMLRGSLTAGQFGAAEEDLVKQINTLLWNDVKGIDYIQRIENALGEMKTIMSPDGKKYFDMSYDKSTRKLSVKPGNIDTGGKGTYSRLGVNPA